MTHPRFQPADDCSQFGRNGFVFRESPAEAQLLEFQHRRVQILSLKHGQLQVHSYRRNGRPCRADQRVRVREFLKRSYYANRSPDGQRLLFPLDPDDAAIDRFCRQIPQEI